jgi:hypothetical protein
MLMSENLHPTFILVPLIEIPSKEVSLEINVERTKYMLLSRHQNIGQNRDTKWQTDRLIMYHSSNIWGRQNLIQENLKRRLNSGSACYHSVQNILSSRLLSRNVKIRIYKSVILPVVLYG